jgi:hypothetical protein
MKIMERETRLELATSTLAPNTGLAACGDEISNGTNRHYVPFDRERRIGLIEHQIVKRNYVRRTKPPLPLLPRAYFAPFSPWSAPVLTRPISVSPWGMTIRQRHPTRTGGGASEALR